MPHLNVRHSFHFFNSARSSHPAAGAASRIPQFLQSSSIMNYDIDTCSSPIFTNLYSSSFPKVSMSILKSSSVDTSARSSRHFTPHADTMKLSAQMSRSRTHSSWLNYHEIDLMITIMPTYNLQSPVYVRYCLSGHPACLVTACDPCP